jgi:hypothetical protein
MNNYNNVLGLNQSFVTAINKRAEACGLPQYMENALTFPPKGKFKTPANASNDGKRLALELKKWENWALTRGQTAMCGMTLLRQPSMSILASTSTT